MLTEKSKQNCDLTDEINRSKRVLDEKYFEAGRLRDESIVKGDQVADLRKQQGVTDKEIAQRLNRTYWSVVYKWQDVKNREA